MEGVANGRIIHYVLKNGKHRPAIIVQEWDEGGGAIGLINVVVFLDGTNDLDRTGDVAEFSSAEIERCTAWRTSIHFSATKEPGTWHWPEKSA